jgi:hypothetical protein
MVQTPSPCFSEWILQNGMLPCQALSSRLSQGRRIFQPQSNTEPCCDRLARLCGWSWENMINLRRQAAHSESLGLLDRGQSFLCWRAMLAIKLWQSAEKQSTNCWLKCANTQTDSASRYPHTKVSGWADEFDFSAPSSLLLAPVRTVPDSALMILCHWRRVTCFHSFVSALPREQIFLIARTGVCPTADITTVVQAIWRNGDSKFYNDYPMALTMG